MFQPDKIQSNSNLDDRSPADTIVPETVPAGGSSSSLPFFHNDENGNGALQEDSVSREERGACDDDDDAIGEGQPDNDDRTILDMMEASEFQSDSESNYDNGVQRSMASQRDHKVVPKVEPLDDDDDEGNKVNDVTNANIENQNDDEEEKDDDYQPKEPSYDKSNSLLFHTLCTRFEKLWSQRKLKSNKRPKEELLDYLLPKQLKVFIGDTSPFPLFRLILPEIDTSRPHNGMKEVTIASAWGEAMGFSRDSRAHQKLLKFNDPTIAGPTAAGDLSVALYEVMEKRFSGKGSNVTVGQINELLDELVRIKTSKTGNASSSNYTGGGSAAHDWRSSLTTTNSQSSSLRGASSNFNKRRQRVRWVEKLIRLGLSPLEHKWLVRILLQRLEIGVGWKSILNYYSPWAEELYSANKSLKRLCTTLSDPEWVQRRKNREKNFMKEIQSINRQNYLPGSTVRASLGNTIAPMLANRTSFASILGDMATRHREFATTLPDDSAGSSSMALKFPTFVAEVKMDGERMLAHINRGVVTMHTRNSTWYSHSYSPILGPALRRAIAYYDVDVILDGEVIAWDNGRKEVIPFGVNRSVAKLRREYLQRRGKIHRLDRNLHEGEDDVNIMSVASSSAFSQPSRATVKLEEEGDDDEPGSDCWLKFVIFDILYVGGPGAADLLSLATAIHPTENACQQGSIIHLNGYQRKIILHSLIVPQENEVEIVDSMVIRSDGQCIHAEDYFSPSISKEYGFHPSVLDSVDCVLEGRLPNLSEIETKRIERRSDEQIEQQRAHSLEQLYADVVEMQCQEGLIFKDLAAPYVLGVASRGYSYWWKLKDDYEKRGHASDIDGVVLGAFYATGMSRSGLLNQFLLGCVDCKSSDDIKFMTLCRVSGGGTARKNLDKLLATTGFKAGSSTEDVQYGKWFKSDSLPDFISKRSFQRSITGDNNGWKFDRKNKPDLYISPENSFVLTINAGEIVSSDAFSAGVSLRFPRIARIRADCFEGGGKPATEVESVSSLHQMYFGRQSQSREMSQLSQGSSVMSIPRESPQECRFLTPHQNSKKKRSSKKTAQSERSQVEVRASAIPTDVAIESVALQGYTFTVLEGTYHLKDGCLDAEEALEQGWSKEAASVTCRRDVINFILRHGGRCELTGNKETDFILGGNVEDARVTNHCRAMEAASLNDMKSTSKRGHHIQKMVEMGGILKWSWPFAVVHKFQEGRDTSNDELDLDQDHNPPELSIKDQCPHLMRPRRFDFLVTSKVSEELLRQTEDAYGVHLWEDSNAIDFRRAIEEVHRIKRKKEYEATKLGAKVAKKRNFAQISGNNSDSNIIPWQYRAFTTLDEHERWVFSGKKQKMWPFRLGESGHKNKTCTMSDCFVIYPDIFGCDLGFEREDEALDEAYSGAQPKKWDHISQSDGFGMISSTLPLARAMGAQVTPHLHDGVTHILCDLRERDFLEWRATISIQAFSDTDNGSRIHNRLITLQCNNTCTGIEKQAVVLVTPQWIRAKWCNEK